MEVQAAPYQTHTFSKHLHLAALGINHFAVLCWLIALVAAEAGVADLVRAPLAAAAESEIGLCFFLRICRPLLLLLWHQQQVPLRPIQRVLPVEPLVLVLISMVTEAPAVRLPAAQEAVAVEQPLLVV